MHIPDIVRFWPKDGKRTISGPLSVLQTHLNQQKTKKLQQKKINKLLEDNQISRAVDLIKGIKLYSNKTNSINKGPYLLTTILNDKNNSKDEAITEIYKMLRPGEPPKIELETQIFNNLFFRSERYAL